MKLFEIIDLEEHESLLRDTHEIFPSKKFFIRHAKVFGEEYIGKRWKLLSEKGETEPFTIEAKPQYAITFSEPEHGEVIVRDKD